jgi:hypothetical protein
MQRVVAEEMQKDMVYNANGSHGYTLQLLPVEMSSLMQWLMSEQIVYGNL